MAELYLLARFYNIALKNADPIVEVHHDARHLLSLSDFFAVDFDLGMHVLDFE